MYQLVLRLLLLLLGTDTMSMMVQSSSASDLSNQQQRQRQEQEQSCTLNCPDDAPCRFGHADFSHHVVELETTHSNGMHCDCPMGWTGVLCDRKYETCDNQAGHECYHGGKCIPGLEDTFGNEQLFCDCSDAKQHGLEYVGKYCETPFEQVCNPNAPEEDQVFCVNGGQCNPDFPDSSQQPCLCDDGWTGYHCEFKEGTVPECTLDCQNDGVCVVGLDSISEAEYMNHRWSLQEIENHMKCICPEGVNGFLCDAPSEECGDNGICLNGGTCVTTVQTLSGGKTKTQYHCDCTTASDGDGNPYAGKYCEHKATDICDDNDWSFFCTQHGECKDNPMEGCKCQPGTAGYKCEFIIDNLDEDEIESDNDQEEEEEEDDDDDDVSATPCNDGYCQNNGICVVEDQILEDGTTGTTEFCDCSQSYTEHATFAGPYCQYRSTSLCYFDAGDLPDTLEGIDFCVHHGTCLDDGSCDCQAGWTGKHCEIATLEINEPGDDNNDATNTNTCGDTVCFNGGKCTETEVIGPDGSLELTLHCDCSSAFDDHYLYAGHSCEFPSTTLCTQPPPGESLEGTLFCTNHGKCMDNVQLGCLCSAGFYGFACEYEDHETNPDDETDFQDDDINDWEVCGDNDLVCHNGGRCVTTIASDEATGTSETQYSCDCSKAFDDETAYLGVSCEYPATTFCETLSENEPFSSALFCVNHGTCKDNPSDGCDCLDGFTGTFCEYKTGADVIIEVGDDEGIDYEECGDDLVCLNGGECVTTIVAGPNGDTTESRYCDCGTAYTETDIFAGPSCEHKATSFCTTAGQNTMENVHFCTNGGQCRDNFQEGCSCDSAWQGFHCEFPVEAEDLSGSDGNDTDDDAFLVACPLDCSNGGICAHGAKDLGNLHDTIGDVSHLNQTFDQEYFAHCICPEGFVGLTCDHKIEICGDDEQVCLHGSKCIIDNNGNHACDCSAADDTSVGNSNKPVFAGDSCQYAGTEICTIGEDYPGKPLYFCTNGGSCNAQVAGDQPDPGCSCPEEYDGDHCEINLEALSAATASSGSKGDAGLIVGIVLAVAVVCVGIAVIGVRWIRATKTHAATVTSTTSGTPFPRRRRRRAGYGVGSPNIAPPNRNSSDFSPDGTITPPELSAASTDSITDSHIISPDNDPEPYDDDDDDDDGIMKDTPEPVELFSDDSAYVDVGPPRDEDGNQLDNVDFV